MSTKTYIFERKTREMIVADSEEQARMLLPFEEESDYDLIDVVDA